MAALSYGNQRRSLVKNNLDFNCQNWFVAQCNISKANSALPQIPEWALCGVMTNSAPDVSKFSQWHWCENRKWAAKCSHNNFLTLVQVFKLPHCCQSTISHHLLLSQSLQPFPWCTFNSKQKQKSDEAVLLSESLNVTNLFSLQGRYRVPQAVKAVFDVVPTFALQCIVVCPFVCLQWEVTGPSAWQQCSVGRRTAGVQLAVPAHTYTSCSAAQRRNAALHPLCATERQNYSFKFTENYWEIIHVVID